MSFVSATMRLQIKEVFMGEVRAFKKIHPEFIGGVESLMDPSLENDSRLELLIGGRLGALIEPSEDDDGYRGPKVAVEVLVNPLEPHRLRGSLQAGWYAMDKGDLDSFAAFLGVQARNNQEEQNGKEDVSAGPIAGMKLGLCGDLFSAEGRLLYQPGTRNEIGADAFINSNLITVGIGILGLMM